MRRPENPRIVEDIRVDNVRDAAPGGGGLRAHDYWANPRFCRILCDLLRQVGAATEQVRGHQRGAGRPA